MQYIVPPKGEICDVVILTNSVDNDVFQMTENAIQSLRKSETENKFNVILVESNQDNIFPYTADIILQYHGEFNYNRALNMAFEKIQSDYVYISNNDVVFKENFFSILCYYLEIYQELGLISPWCPIPQIGPNPIIQKAILQYPAHCVVMSQNPIEGMNGWGWLIKTETLNLIRPLNEILSFWFQDNHIIYSLNQLGLKCGQCTASQVIHLGQKSYRTIPQSELHNMTVGLQQKYTELIQKPQ